MLTFYSYILKYLKNATMKLHLLDFYWSRDNNNTELIWYFSLLLIINYQEIRRIQGKPFINKIIVHLISFLSFYLINMVQLILFLFVIIYIMSMHLLNIQKTTGKSNIINSTYINIVILIHSNQQQCNTTLNSKVILQMAVKK